MKQSVQGMQNSTRLLQQKIATRQAVSGGLVLPVLGATWLLGRAVLCALLVLIEPLLRITLVPLAFLSFGVTLLFGFFAGSPSFPKWGMLTFSIGALLLYWSFLGLLSWLIGGRR